MCIWVCLLVCMETHSPEKCLDTSELELLEIIPGSSAIQASTQLLSHLFRFRISLECFSYAEFRLTSINFIYFRLPNYSYTVMSIQMVWQHNIAYDFIFSVLRMQKIHNFGLPLIYIHNKQKQISLEEAKEKAQSNASRLQQGYKLKQRI